MMIITMTATMMKKIDTTTAGTIRRFAVLSGLVAASLVVPSVDTGQAMLVAVSSGVIVDAENNNYIMITTMNRPICMPCVVCRSPSLRMSTEA